MQGLRWASINFNNKARHPVPTIRIYMYTVNRNCVDLCLQGSGDLRMCGSQTDWNIARILMFFTVFGWSFDVLSGIWCQFVAKCFLLQGGVRLLGHALLLRHIRYAYELFCFLFRSRPQFGYRHMLVHLYCYLYLVISFCVHCKLQLAQFPPVYYFSINHMSLSHFDDC